VIAVVAIALGLGLTAGTASAAAATPSHHAKVAHSAHHTHPITFTTDDWWW
jgi:hypothetical protein